MPGPDTYVEQVRVQHPVGHGFFHSATLRSKVHRFDYIVDCGGASSALARQIKAFKEGRDVRPLDLLVVTHFHADHIGGLEVLLSDLKVTAVAVPYLSPEEKLLCLAALSRKRRDAKDEQLVLRPREWAQERGAKIVYLVHGDADRPPEGVPPPPEPLRDGPRNSAPEDQRGEWVLAPRGAGRPAPGVYALTHTTPLEVRSMEEAQWGFHFFCHQSSKLKQTVEHSLQKKRWAPIRSIFKRIQRRDSSNILSSAKIRRQLREWYEFLVGDDLNLTSLSLLSAPTAARAAYLAVQGQREVSRPWDKCYWWYSDGQRVGWLGTGDAMLKQSDLVEAFLERFGEIGLDRIACMSLPHHGSARNHSGRVLDRIDPAVIFVTCPLKANVHHPSPEVERAVRARGGNLIKVTERESSILCERVHVWLD